MSSKKIVSQDNVGKVFGRLTVLREYFTPIKTVPNKQVRTWECLCVCGVGKNIRAYHVKRGNVQSCGCYQKERIRTHDLSRTPEYRIWHGMVQRTCNPNNPSYKNYGGRGITIFPLWRRSFKAFIDNVGQRPSSLHTIERIDNNKGYEPNNVKWDTRHNQNRNHRRNHMITFNGETLCIKDWAIRLGLGIHAINYRLQKWPIELALTTPNLKGKKLIN